MARSYSPISLLCVSRPAKLSPRSRGAPREESRQVAAIDTDLLSGRRLGAALVALVRVARAAEAAAAVAVLAATLAAVAALAVWRTGAQ